MMTQTMLLASRLLLVASLGVGAPPSGSVSDIQADPVIVRLSGPQARYSLLVHGKTADGTLIDLTRDARYQALKPDIASVSADGVVQARADGTTEVTVEVAG